MCDRCGRALESLVDSYLVIEAYKKPGCARASFIAHGNCFDDAGCYLIALNRIVKPDDLDAWDLQLQQKKWWIPDDKDDLVRAHAYAKRLYRPPRPRRPKRVRRKRPKIGNGLRARVFERDGFACRRCGRRPPAVVLNADHVVPVARGGPTALYNLQTLCDGCNAGKGSREPHTRDLEVKGVTR